MAEYGRRRSPAKRVYWETGIEGSNPSLSVNTKRTVEILSFLYLQGIRSQQTPIEYGGERFLRGHFFPTKSEGIKKSGWAEQTGRLRQ